MASSGSKIINAKLFQKPYIIKLGDWEDDVLSSEQLQYAATDAFASWSLYEALKSLPDAAEYKSEELLIKKQKQK